MHEFQHVVSGDTAAGTLKAALQLEPGDLVVMRDDLSVGPLADVEQPPFPIRSAFWRRVLGPEGTLFAATQDVDQLGETAAAFANLPADPRPAVVWTGTGANEQLTLRRVASLLSQGTRPLWVIEVLPEDQKPLPQHWRSGVGVLNEVELRRILPRRRLIDDKERQSLALEWRRLQVENSTETMCRSIAGKIETQPIASHDADIAAAADKDWQRTVKVVGHVMGHAEDHISDIFIFWRLRERAWACWSWTCRKSRCGRVASAASPRLRRSVSGTRARSRGCGCRRRCRPPACNR